MTLDMWHQYLTCYTWHLISDTWYLMTLVFDMLYLTPDPWHWYLTLVLDMLYLTPNFWHLISDTGTWHAITWYLIPGTWYITLDDWHAITHLTCFHMAQAHLTWYCDTWLDNITPDTCVTLHIHDYHFYGDLAWLLYCYWTFGTPELLCSWTPVYLNPWNRETPDIMLLILYSSWSPY